MKNIVSKLKMLAIILPIFALNACVTVGPNGQSGFNINKELIGGVLGAAGGAFAGSKFGKGNGQLAAVAIGTLGGTWIGSSIGASLDDVDRMKMQMAQSRALNTLPSNSNQAVSWNNPDTGHSGYVRPTGSTSATCRTYEHTIVIDGQQQVMRGQACRNPDGTWRQA